MTDLTPKPADIVIVLNEDNAKAVIENGCIVIRVPINNLDLVVEVSSDAGFIVPPMRVTNAQVFAEGICRALNAEEEDGTTVIHALFDDAIMEAYDQGAEGIEPQDDEEPE